MVLTQAEDVSYWWVSVKAFTYRNVRLSDGVWWVFIGQGVSAICTLIGLRLMTEMVAPDIYGEVALTVGVVSLAAGIVSTPLLQAVLRFYSELDVNGKSNLLRNAVFHILLAPTTAMLLVLFIVLSSWRWHGAGTFGFVSISLALFLIEMFRSFELAFLSARSDQRTVALLVVADAGARPAAAVGLVWLVGESATVVIAGYLFGAIIPLVCFYLRQGIPVVAATANDAQMISERLWSYAKPLFLLPIMGWVSGQVDRYLLAAFAGLGPAGIYAAIYGIASRPFLMLTSGIEMILRQDYYRHVSASDKVQERRIFRVWLATVLGSSLFIAFLIALFHRQIAALLVAEQYRTHSALMAWVSAGYVLFAGAQVVERICYAKHDTKGVFLIQAASSALGVIVVLPMIKFFGIDGAAWSVSIYFGFQLVLTIWRARWMRHDKKTSSQPVASIYERAK